jgi:hypothetical protein
VLVVPRTRQARPQVAHFPYRIFDAPGVDVGQRAAFFDLLERNGILRLRGEVRKP